MFGVGEGTDCKEQKLEMNRPLFFVLTALLLLGGGFALTTSLVNAAPDTTLIVNETNDELNNDSDCSLREAIRATNLNTAVGGCPATSATDTIQLTSGATYTLTIDSNNNDADTDDTSVTGDLDILQDLKVKTNSTGRAIIKGKLLWKERLVEIAPNINVTFTRIEFRNGNATNGLGGGGLGIGTGANVSLSGSVVADNDAEGNGGGILNNGNLTIANSTISGNQSAKHNGGGGGIYSAPNTSLTINNGTISNNESEGDGSGDNDGGGGIFANDANMTITDSTIDSNNVKGDRDSGGGIYEFGNNSVTTITGSSIINNTGGQDIGLDNNEGAGIFAHGNLTINRTLIAGNQAKSIGDGAGAHVGGALITNSIIRDNTTGAGNGGGIFISADSQIFNTTISGNHSKGGVAGLIGDGGGIYISLGDVLLQNVTVSGNKADRGGGGIAIQSLSHLDLLNVTVTNNTSNNDLTSGGQGGGLFMDFSIGAPTVMMRNSILSGNIEGGVGTHDDCEGTVTADPFNIVHVTDGCTFINSSNVVRDDPKLAALADNGGFTAGDGSGEAVKTNALQSGSPAIDAGGAAFLCSDLDGFSIATDERGANFPRPIDGDNDGTPHCDMGAFEFGSAPFTATPTKTLTPTPTNTPTRTTTSTPTTTFTPTRTNTPTPTATSTNTATKTFTPTNTPTKTFTPPNTATKTLTPTNTPTNPAGNTSTPTRTATIAPPTHTPTATAMDACSGKPAKPQLKTPVDGATLPTSHPTLKWSAAACAETYNVYVKHFITGINADSKKHLTILHYQTKILDAGKYKWFIKACNASGCKKSDTHTFTLQ